MSLRASQVDLLRAVACGMSTDVALALAVGVDVPSLRRQLIALAGRGLLALQRRGAVWSVSLTLAGEAALSGERLSVRRPVQRSAYRQELRRLPASARLDRLHGLALRSMYRADAGTPERRVREARAVALALAWADAVKVEAEREWVA